MSSFRPGGWRELPVELLGRVPQPELAATAASALRAAAAAAREAHSWLLADSVTEGWQGRAAMNAHEELGGTAAGLLQWSGAAEALAGRAELLTSALRAELLRRQRVRETVLNTLGRLAQLPTTIHRDGSRWLAEASQRLAWDGDVLPLGPTVPLGHHGWLRLPRLGTLGWDVAASALRALQP